mmetsp:Transcript_37923/g.122648  ORF Transcript_37923/g.122648 Transcript_37923/m.122648 type:complete len:218 (-) Transcript_37923:1124-1777(-)
MRGQLCSPMAICSTIARTPSTFISRLAEVAITEAGDAAPAAERFSDLFKSKEMFGLAWLRTSTRHWNADSEKSAGTATSKSEGYSVWSVHCTRRYAGSTSQPSTVTSTRKVISVAATAASLPASCFDSSKASSCFSRSVSCAVAASSHTLSSKLSSPSGTVGGPVSEHLSWTFSGVRSSLSPLRVPPRVGPAGSPRNMSSSSIGLGPFCCTFFPHRR